LAVIALLIVLIAVPKILHALEGGNPWWALVAAACVVVSLIPVPGGVGTVDAGVLGTLVVFGQSAQRMAARTIACHPLSLAIPAMAGGVGFILLRRRMDATDAAAESEVPACA